MAASIVARVFQSTRPIRSATNALGFPSATDLFQSTRPIRGATPESSLPVYSCLFQSTRPIRGATFDLYKHSRFFNVSIHAPHTRRDNQFSMPAEEAGRFNPRAPYEARRPKYTACGASQCFNPRAPYE